MTGVRSQRGMTRVPHTGKLFSVANVLYNAACTYALLQKNVEEALDMLRKAINAGWSNLEWVLRDPDLTSLHDDPEFQQLCQRA